MKPEELELLLFHLNKNTKHNPWHVITANKDFIDRSGAPIVEGEVYLKQDTSRGGPRLAITTARAIWEDLNADPEFLNELKGRYEEAKNRQD
ncbi:MAG: hypothetical protein JW981_10085 [Anaerolineae bacterium]|nr:hypothetical protein [Anaerolineae bacterium]